MENVNLKAYDKAFLNYINGDYDKLSDLEKEIFCENRVSIDNKNVTLNVICAGLGIEVPEKFKEIADEKQKVQFREKYVRPGDVSIILRSAEAFEMGRLTTKTQYELAIKNGAKLIIMGKDDFEKFELKEEDFPVILVDNINERILRFFSLLREQEKAKVVMITGSVGKTTTKDLCHLVVKNSFKTFANTKNTNTVHRTAQHLMYKTNKDNEVYIQETGAGYRGSVRFAASMLQPDIFILTNVYAHHLEIYESIENVFEDKTSADDYLKKDGIIITNFDDERIRNHSFKHKVVSFAINHEDVDFRALNVRQDKDQLMFDVYEKATGKTTPMSVKVLGEHNVYNILTAFALGKAMGLKEEQIQEELDEYRPEGIRQNLSNIGGIYFNVDCYNVAEESISAMLSAGENFQLEEGGKRYAVIGGENKLGKEVKTRSEDFGKKIAGVKMDKILFCTVENQSEKSLNKYGDAVSIQKGFNSLSNTPNELSKGLNDIIKFLEDNVRRGDLVMLKGIYYLDMCIAVDKVFGTDYSFNLAHYVDKKRTIEKRNYKALLIKQFKELELTNAKIKDGKLVIPNKIGKYPVFRITEKAFRKNEEITQIKFGKNIKNIGERAFTGCKKLRELEIPQNVKVIGERAFINCSKLSKVTLGEGVAHIGERAFKNCKKLEKIFIPESVGMIGKDAFAGCKKLVIACEKDTFAHKYAEENNIPFVFEKPKKGFMSKLLSVFGK